ncbi:MAG: dihydropteroate synthase [Chitinispirillaceae bacterium]|nr:dihydropteroate synthase [Chitinispirillaceae bacterium]
MKLPEGCNNIPYPCALLEAKEHHFAVMGIVNVTPDSFFDGGKYHETDAAVTRARELVSQGADIIDIGGASSRPGAEPVSPGEELRRVVPVIEGVADFFSGPISIDTTWSSVARGALSAGATWINDISAGRCDPGMVPLAAETGCVVVLMHSRETPQTMQLNPRYENVTAEVIAELLDAVEMFRRGGADGRRLVLDPGIGFAKTAEHNVTLLKEIRKLADTGFPVLAGTSRKSFLGHLTGKTVEDRLPGSLASVATAWYGGVRIFRVHDVAATVDFLTVLTGLS